MLRLLIALCLPFLAHAAPSACAAGGPGRHRRDHRRGSRELSADPLRRAGRDLGASPCASAYDKANRTVVDLACSILSASAVGAAARATVSLFPLKDALLRLSPGARSPAAAGTSSFRGSPMPARMRAAPIGSGYPRSWRRPPTASAAIADGLVRAGPGWFRGDLHMHDAHSDAAVPARRRKVPCPLFRTVDVAARAGSDFAAVTDHNTVQH